MDAIERLAAARAGQLERQLPEDQDAAKEFPQLWNALTRQSIGKDQEYIKEPCSLSIKLGMGEWIVSIRDETLCCSLEVASATLSLAFQALERELGKSLPSWRVWKGKEPVLRKKPKRS